MRLAILISGRGSNMQAILRNAREGCLQGLCEVVAVISNKHDAPGLAIARDLGVATHVAVSESEQLGLLEQMQPDLVVLAGFMRILSLDFVARFPRRIVNIHPADTAQYRSLRGYQWAFESGLQQTWITVHFVDEGIDTGEVLAKAPVDLRGADTLEEVKRRGLQVEHSLYSKTIKKVITTCVESSAFLDPTLLPGSSFMA